MYKKLFNPFICLFLFSLIISGCKKEEPHFFELDKTVLIFEIEGGSQNISVSSNRTWTISNNADWITVLPMSGNGNATVAITALENETFEVRETTLTFSSETKTVTVEITQRAKEFYLELDKVTLAFEAEGGSQNIVVLSNETWSVSNDVSWITVLPQTGNVNTTVTVTADLSVRSEIRTARLTFSVGTKSVMVDITQEGNKNPQGIVINSVRWATHNVDMPGTFAENPESPGMFYQWNRKIGWSASDPHVNSDSGTEWNWHGATSIEWEKANDPCPRGWRVPTRTELQTLGNTDNVTSERTTINSVNGRTFVDINTSNILFLPAVGQRNEWSGALVMAGTHGNYWSSTFSTFSNATFAWLLHFNSTGVNTGNAESLRAFGFSVRCVAE